MIRANAKATFHDKIDDPALKESFITGSGWIFGTIIEVKANIINESFVQMCSETSTSSTLPTLFREVKSVLRSSLLGGKVFCNLFDLWIAKISWL